MDLKDRTFPRDEWDQDDSDLMSDEWPPYQGRITELSRRRSWVKYFDFVDGEGNLVDPGDEIIFKTFLQLTGSREQNIDIDGNRTQKG
jgi:hypothetical protein